MRRGEIWTLAGDQDYASKPRPVIVLQDDRFCETVSITICALTTNPTEAPLFRLPVIPNQRNGLREPCKIMVDKIISVPKTKIGKRIGKLDDSDMLRLNRAAIVFLGLGVSPRSIAGS